MEIICRTMKNLRVPITCLLAVFLTNSSVVADEPKLLATHNESAADTRRTAPDQRQPSSRPADSNVMASAVTTNALPPLPPGVVELKFNQFFRQPVGPRGLELTETLRALAGRRVRLVGFMVREHEPSRAGGFLLTPYPLTLDEEEFGLCDDLPASVTLVQIPHRATEVIPHQSGRVIVTGTLSLGAHEEANGRVFLVRLTQDEVPAER